MLMKCSFFSASKVQGYDSKQMPECIQRNPNLFAKKWNVSYYDKKRWTERDWGGNHWVFSLLLKDEIV